MVRLTPGDKNVVPNGPGVYMVCASPPGYRQLRKKAGDVLKLLYAPVYVGKSKDLKARFTNHCLNPKSELVQGQKCFEGNLDFWFVQLASAEIHDLETSLIDCFGPPANLIAGIRARLGKPVPA
jgi:hypothetical protein